MNSVRFALPQFLWLLIAPGLLLVAWVWQFAVRRRDVRRFRRHRRVPVHERFPIFGNLMSWLCLIFASACLILAMARPTAVTAVVRTAGIDLVILQDGSASMWTEDVPGSRWQRSMRFLRTLAESLIWKDDRMAMALFAHVAAPQVRLTRDPTTFFFFLDHLARQSPFRLEDDPTWDTNIELGIAWGMRLIDRDTEINGRSPNARTFILISDGQAWSGEVARSLRLARTNDVPVWVVGVGTTVGGTIPDPLRKPGGTTSGAPSIRSSLDRASLMTIANAGGGEYLELDRTGDRETASRIIDATRKRAGSRGLEVAEEEVYWRLLLLAAGLICAAPLFWQEPIELWLQVSGAGVALAVVWALMR